jgi:predicted phage terminase large subunit-like protein
LAVESLIIQPHPGPQEAFLASPADIVIFGGEAGGGKTHGLLMETFRGWDVPGYSAVIFRRTTPEITNPGGMWDESRKLYQPMGLTPRGKPDLDWRNADNTFQVKFAGLEYDDDVYGFDGSQIPYIGFDQLEHFTEFQFWYMLSRNRTTCGIAPYIRASCNPDPDSWLAAFIGWWIAPDGYPVEERSGVIRWFVRIRDELHWGDSKAEVMSTALANGVPVREAKAMPKSVTFIPSSVHDNPTLLESDPGYLANLLALPEVERMRLYGGPGRRGGNWLVRYRAGAFLNRAWFGFLEAPPVATKRVRYWDKAGTEGAGAFTTGTLMSESGVKASRQWAVEDVKRGQWSSMRREAVILETAREDGPNVTVWVEQEPGSGGKESAENTIRNLAGFRIYADRVTGDKFERARPFAAQAEARNVKLVRSPWNEAYLRELHNADPMVKNQLRDQMDSSSGAFNKLVGHGYGLGIA